MAHVDSVDFTAKSVLRRYLQTARDVMLWKLDGLSEYDVRRPLTPTATNLLGLVKHLTGVELLYFGWVFGRNFEEMVPWFRPDLGFEGMEVNEDMWATAEESRAYIVDLYRRAWAHSDATIEALPLDATGEVPWWPEERRWPTLLTVLVHTIAETHRHAGHADIVRELIDGAAGLRADSDNMPPEDQAWWQTYRSGVEQAAQQASRN
jgi:Protein of unknown function (DUF664)